MSPLLSLISSTLLFSQASLSLELSSSPPSSIRSFLPLRRKRGRRAAPGAGGGGRRPASQPAAAASARGQEARTSWWGRARAGEPASRRRLCARPRWWGRALLRAGEPREARAVAGRQAAARRRQGRARPGAGRRAGQPPPSRAARSRSDVDGDGARVRPSKPPLPRAAMCRGRHARRRGPGRAAYAFLFCFFLVRDCGGQFL